MQAAGGKSPLLLMGEVMVGVNNVLTFKHFLLQIPQSAK